MTHINKSKIRDKCFDFPDDLGLCTSFEGLEHDVEYRLFFRFFLYVGIRVRSQANVKKKYNTSSAGVSCAEVPAPAAEAEGAPGAAAGSAIS
jgi:hypothetical protein